MNNNDKKIEFIIHNIKWTSNIKRNQKVPKVFLNTLSSIFYLSTFLNI